MPGSRGSSESTSPEAVATGAPESPTADGSAVLAVGGGPGDTAFLTGRATAALVDADDPESAADSRFDHLSVLVVRR